MGTRLTGRRIGFAAAASHCTLEKAIAAIDGLTAEGAEVFPIMNPMIAQMVTRFGTGEGWLRAMAEATGHTPWTQIPEVEPIGPKELLDALVVAPCTGSTLSKLANAQTEASVAPARGPSGRSARVGATRHPSGRDRDARGAGAPAPRAAAGGP